MSVELATNEEFGDPKFTRRSYYYGLWDTDEVDQHYALLAWHWQPDDPNWSYPHMHAPLPNEWGNRSVGAKLHVPTAERITIEEVVRFLIEEKMVKPVDADWDQKLADAAGRVHRFQTR